MDVEIRSHVAGPIPAFVTEHTELTLILEGDGQSKVHRAAHGVRQHAAAVRGTTFVIPVGTHEEATYLTADIPEVMHLYLSRRLFEAVAVEDHLPCFNPANIRYVSGICDASLSWIGTVVARELRHQTSSASILVETIGLSIAERMVANYGEGVSMRAARVSAAGALDSFRLRRMLAYIEGNLGSELSIQALAAVACLSPFHFARAFRQATGGSPRRYVSSRRLALAKQLLRDTDCSLAEIAAICCFSSAANLSRAFSRAVGCAPGRFRTQTHF
ncbi:AraC family transcriptional regulator (plasmid) [Polymorphobacter sp. PAMC 29334]|uniref:helix-turn-helix domain-containing protein n=1 Tax=Polymorphobacter sp. PAMC 29334 TaxID=2862331 RepID=UPI001C675991|nr:AraC family transcriptional regulator [Polymorphobacter sp. PAMC 29334]QYE33275.1 AraC family transcriptional regulator [Polymorphobacter sp. PAMC 29334]